MSKRGVIGYLLYHFVRPFVKMPDVMSLYFHNPAPDTFERMIEWAKNEGYEFYDVDTLCRYLSGDVVSGGKMAIITLDDAWQGNINLIPIIEKHNIPVTIFAPVEPLISGNYWWEYVQKRGGKKLSTVFKGYEEEKFNAECARIRKEISLNRSAMTIDQLKSVSEHPLVEIGCHSYTHPILTKVSDSNLVFELKESKEFLENIIGKKVTSFSYPNGTFTEREAEIVRANYRCAFTVVQDTPRKGGDLYSIPRFAMTNDFWSNLAKILGAWKLIKS